MRDLKADLEICNKATPGPWVRKYENNIKQAVSDRGICSCSYSSNIDSTKTAQENSDNMEFIAQAREGWPHAIERAINAEAEVELYELIVKYIEAENAQLRKVADAARALVPIEMYQYTRHLFELKHALDEYDKAKEGQDGKSI